MKPTRTGDNGKTALQSGRHAAKSDDVMQALTALDELNAHLGLILSRKGVDTADFQAIRRHILAVIAFLSDTAAQHASFAAHTQALEIKIGNMRRILPRKSGLVTCGRCEQAALLDMARAVTRRAETHLAKATKGHVNAQEILAYVNRLSDYWYTLARMADFEDSVVKAVYAVLDERNRDEPLPPRRFAAPLVPRSVGLPGGELDALTLKHAKMLMERIEQKAAATGLAAAIACCDNAGNPIAVHVMDNAYLVSCDAALSKAYTAAALKMPTAELAQHVLPGGMFYGLDSLKSGKIVPIGGGVPIFGNNGKLLGGLGVSGGTAAQDIELADFGLLEVRKLGQ